MIAAINSNNNLRREKDIYISSLVFIENRKVNRDREFALSRSIFSENGNFFLSFFFIKERAFVTWKICTTIVRIIK